MTKATSMASRAPDKMKAIVQDRYGSPEDVLTLRDVPTPVVKDDEVLVRVRAASMHVDVWSAVTGRPYIIRLLWSGLRKPKNPIPGLDVAGEVEAVGKAVTQFKRGDEVFGESLKGISVGNGGTFAEYASAPQETLALKPAHITFEQAAAVSTSGIITLMTLRALGDIKPGQRVLINGAGGAVGSIAIQLCKARGAHVTGIDNDAKLMMMRSLGADAVVDYTKDDFTQRPERYDFIFDVASNLSMAAWKRVLVPTGLYWRVSHDHFGAVGTRTFGSLPSFFRLVGRATFDRQLPRLRFAVPTKRDSMEVLRRLLEDGTLTPIVARTFALGEVPAALRCLEEGRTAGRIVITP